MPILISVVVLLASTSVGLYVASLCNRGRIESVLFSILCGPVGPLLIVLLAIHQQREAHKEETRAGY